MNREEPSPPNADDEKGKFVDELEVKHIKRADSDMVDSDAFTKAGEI